MKFDLIKGLKITGVGILTFSVVLCLTIPDLVVFNKMDFLSILWLIQFPIIAISMFMFFILIGMSEFLKLQNMLHSKFEQPLKVEELPKKGDNPLTRF